MTGSSDVLSYIEEKKTSLPKTKGKNTPPQQTQEKKEIKDVLIQGNNETSEVNKKRKAPKIMVYKEWIVANKDNLIVDEKTAPEILLRCEANKEQLPWDLILEKIENNETISYEIQRKKKTQKNWTIWWPKWFEFAWIGEIISTQNNEVEWNIVTYLTMEPLQKDPLIVQISAKAVEFPYTKNNNMTNKRIVYSKTLTGKEFAQEKKLEE